GVCRDGHPSSQRDHRAFREEGDRRAPPQGNGPREGQARVSEEEVAPRIGNQILTRPQRGHGTDATPWRSTLRTGTNSTSVPSWTSPSGSRQALARQGHGIDVTLCAA